MTYVPLENALRSVLVTAATDAESRIYPQVLPQNVTLPAVAYQQLGDDPIDDIDGHSGLFHSRVQYDAFAATFNDVKALIEQIRLALQGYTGTVLGVTIKGVQLETKLDLYEPEVQEYRSVIRFIVWHRETNP